MLDEYEAVQSGAGGERKIADPRWRIEHAQIVNPEDIPRFAKLGVIPSMQPSHAIGDLFFAPSRLGIKRSRFIRVGDIKSALSCPADRTRPLSVANR